MTSPPALSPSHHGRSPVIEAPIAAMKKNTTGNANGNVYIENNRAAATILRDRRIMAIKAKQRVIIGKPPIANIQIIQAGLTSSLK